MNWKEAKSKWRESMEEWESIKKDYANHDFIKTSYLVLCWGDYGQAEIKELYPLGLLRHIDLIKDGESKNKILNLTKEISKLERLKLKQRNSYYWIEKKIEHIEQQIIEIIENSAEFKKNWIEARFQKLNFKGIAELKKHPLINKDSYGIRIILR